MGIDKPEITPPDIKGFFGQLIKDHPKFEAMFVVQGIHYPDSKGGAIKPGNFVTCVENLKTIYEKESKDKSKKICMLVFDFFAAEWISYIMENGQTKKAIAARYEKLDKENYWFYVLHETDWKESTIQKTKEKNSFLAYFPLVDSMYKKKMFTKEKGKEFLKLKDYVKALNKTIPQPNELSMFDVYSAIATLGKLKPGSLRELHIFSHAFSRGPILVNTFQTRSLSFKKQKLVDKDGRIGDFEHTEFKAMAADFKKAFSDIAFSMIWGCFVNEGIQKGIRAITEKVVYLKNNPNDIEYDKKKISIKDYKNSEVEVKLNGKNKKIKDMVKEIEDEIAGTYAKALVAASGKGVIAALPGTTALFDKDGFAFPFIYYLMHIPLGDKYQNEKKNKLVEENFDKELKFYQSIMKIRFARDTAHLAIAPYLYDYDTKGFGRGYAGF